MKPLYDKESIASMDFESSEPADLWERKESSSYYLTAAEIAGMPESDDKRIVDLRKKLSDYFAEKFGFNYSRLETDCDIKTNTFQKAIRFRNGRNITYSLLAKFCVGAKLTVDEAEELFMMMGYQLNDKNRSDYILKCEFSKHCDITEYDSDLKKYGLKGILSDDGKDDKDEE